METYFCQSDTSQKYSINVKFKLYSWKYISANLTPVRNIPLKYLQQGFLLFLSDQRTFNHEGFECPVDDPCVLGRTSVQTMLLSLRDSPRGQMDAGVETRLTNALVCLQKFSELERQGKHGHIIHQGLLQALDWKMATVLKVARTNQAAGCNCNRYMETVT